MEINVILAISKDNIIAVNNKLPWNIPSDLNMFKQKTMGYPIIMGRKTFESLPGVLPGRKNIVITSKKDYNKKGIEVACSLEEALSISDKEKVFIIGGAQVCEEAFNKDIVDNFFLSRVDVYLKNKTGEKTKINFPKNYLNQPSFSSRCELEGDEYPYDFIIYKNLKK